jgi:uncharacterized protein (TIGR03083 family)
VIDVDILAMIGAERRRIADLVDSLSEEELAAPSLCHLWTIKQVAAHVTPNPAPLRQLLWRTVRAGFNIHLASARFAQELANRPATEIAARLRAQADNPFRPPVVGYPGALTDLQVHGQDMRRPLGRPHGLRPEALRVSLNFLVSGRPVGFVRRGSLAGLRFIATDQDWAHGQGPQVSGPSEALLMAMTGRGVALADLSGAGLPLLRERLAG